MNVNKPIVISEEEELEFRNATRCSNCNKKSMNVMNKLYRDVKTQKTKMTNSSEVLSWGVSPKTKKQNNLGDSLVSKPKKQNKPTKPILGDSLGSKPKKHNKTTTPPKKKQLLGGLGLGGSKDSVRIVFWFYWIFGLLPKGSPRIFLLYCYFFFWFTSQRVSYDPTW